LASSVRPSLPPYEHVELLRKRLTEYPDEPIVFKNRSIVKLRGKEGGVTVVWHGFIEATHFSMHSLEKAMDYALNGSRCPPGPLYRAHPSKPPDYRPPEQLARELRQAHKQKLLLDIPIPTESSTETPSPLAPDQPF
jgi:hypothetical protein